jgi:hypothetical protein
MEPLQQTTGMPFCGVAGRQGWRLKKAQGIEAEQKPLTGILFTEFALREWYSQVNKV